MPTANCFSQDTRPDFTRMFPHDTLKIPKTRLNILKTNPLAIALSQVPWTGELRVMYERVELPKQSTVIGLSFIMLSPLLADSIQAYYKRTNGVYVRIFGFRFQAAQRFYLTQWNSPEGFYVSPHASYNITKWSFYYAYTGASKKVVYSALVNFININVLVGFQKLIRKKLAIDVNIGVGYRYNFFKEKNSQTVVPIDFEKDTGIPNWLKLSYTSNFGFAFR